MGKVWFVVTALAVIALAAFTPQRAQTHRGGAVTQVDGIQSQAPPQEDCWIATALVMESPRLDSQGDNGGLASASAIEIDKNTALIGKSTAPTVDYTGPPDISIGARSQISRQLPAMGRTTQLICQHRALASGSQEASITTRADPLRI